MGNQYVSMARFMELQRRTSAAAADADRTTAWANTCTAQSRCHFVLATTGVSISVGVPTAITTSWPGDAFDDGSGNMIPYGVELIPTGLIGKGSYGVTAQSANDVTVTITATLIIAIGAQFLLHGCTRLPAQ